MRLGDEQESDNVEDGRGSGGGMARVGGLGIGTVVIALVASYFFGIDPSTILNIGQAVQQQVPSAPSQPIRACAA